VTGKRYTLTTPAPSPASGFLVSAALTVTGTYKTQFLLTVSMSPASLSRSNVTPPNGWFDAGTSALLTATTPIIGYGFQTWTGAVPSSPNSTNPLSVTMDQARTIAANYLNPGPTVIITGPPSGSIYAVNANVSFTGTITDQFGDTHTAVWAFDSINQPGIVTQTPTGGNVSKTYQFSTPGVYQVTLTVTDSVGQTAQANTVNGDPAFVVIYDPNGGFVTGGGWIMSPVVSALSQYMSVSAKANFGFVSKYQKGATVPTGETEFQFKEGNLNFKSSSYEWLVVAGARAQYKGVGTINGSGNYGFMLTAIDSQVSGGGPVDKFRIKIWDKANGDTVVYDNQYGQVDDSDAGTALGGGSIVIHK
jgi:hypothetical protein